MLLATQNTGRGGSGSREAKAQQERIVGAHYQADVIRPVCVINQTKRRLGAMSASPLQSGQGAELACSLVRFLAPRRRNLP